MPFIEFDFATTSLGSITATTTLTMLPRDYGQ